jgi:hypothetical protein
MPTSFLKIMSSKNNSLEMEFEKLFLTIYPVGFDVFSIATINRPGFWNH